MTTPAADQQQPQTPAPAPAAAPPQAPPAPPSTPPAAAAPPVAPPAAVPGEKKRFSTDSTKHPAQFQVKDPETGRFVRPGAIPITPAAAPAAESKPATPPPAPPQAPAAPVKPQHPAWLVEMAKTSGFTQEQMDRLDSNALGEGVRFAQARFSQPVQPVQPQQPAAPPAPAPEPTFDLGLTDDQKEVFGPELMAVLNKLGTENAKLRQQIDQGFNRFEQREVARNQAQMAHAIDTAIAGLPAEYQQIIGGGNGTEIMQTQPDVFSRRAYVLTVLQQRGLDFSRASPAEIQARVKAQVEKDWAIRPTNPAPAPPVSRADWDRGGSPPPTSARGPDNLPPLEKGSTLDDRLQALTEEEAEEDKIRSAFRRRKSPRNGAVT